MHDTFVVSTAFRQLVNKRICYVMLGPDRLKTVDSKQADRPVDFGRTPT